MADDYTPLLPGMRNAGNPPNIGDMVAYFPSGSANPVYGVVIEPRNGGGVYSVLMYNEEIFVLNADALHVIDPDKEAAYLECSTNIQIEAIRSRTAKMIDFLAKGRKKL
ncbi:MAG: hypothetical protein HY364_04660 [Candidatus Aenigmarchaeota archaeon]|nr:hypothetical protein [Candidatus Aenigmarchaeota archaeon]